MTKLQNDVINALLITLRADFGGGPEHLWQLLLHQKGDANAFVACPNDYPYFDRYIKNVGSGKMFLLPHRQFSLRHFFSLRSFCQTHRIDVIHAHGKGAGLYARLVSLTTGIPSVYTFHGLHTDGYSLAKKQVYLLYERLAAFFTAAAIAVSPGEQARIFAANLFPKEKLFLIPNAVALPRRKATRPMTSPLRVVSFTRFNYQKNSQFILKIAEKLSQRNQLDRFRFLLVGEGEQREWIAAEAERCGLGDAISCPGATPTPFVYFDKAFAYLSTSLWEGMPLAVLEAMAHGIPVIASDVVGNTDALLGGELGMLFGVSDAAMAADWLCALADSPEAWEALSQKGHEHISLHQNIAKMADTTWTVLHAVAFSKA